MKKNSCMIFVDILFLIGVVYLFSMCSGNRTKYDNDNNYTHGDYNINHYIDTINGHMILSTVVDSKYYNNISIATLELNNN